MPKIVFLLVLAMLTGCASIEPMVNAGAPADTRNAYIAGKFTHHTGGGYAYVLVNLDTGAEYALSLGEDNLMPTKITDQVVAIKIPAGRYSVSKWFTYATLTKERGHVYPVRSPFLSAPFTAAGGSVTFLGSFYAETAYRYPTISMLIQPKIGSTAAARLAFHEAYPLLRELSFTCILCEP